MRTNKDDVVRRYIPTVIHGNVQKFLEHRQLELVNGSVSKRRSVKIKTDGKGFLSDELFTKVIQIDGYVIIEAKDKPDKKRRFHKSISAKNRDKPTKTFIVILDVATPYASASGQFATLLKRIPGVDQTKRNYNLDIIIISKKNLSKSSHMSRKVATFVTNGSTDNGFLNIHTHPYNIFTTYLLDPDHKSIPKHYILTLEEEQALVNSINADKKDLPRIKKGDPPLVWLGAQIGDVILIELEDEAAGINPKYHIVIG